MASEDLSALFADFWTWRLDESPEFATQLGINQNDALLDNYEVSSFERRKSKCIEFIGRAKALESGLASDDDRFNVNAFIEMLNTYIQGIDHAGYKFPINQLEGVHVDFERVVEWMKFENKNDYQKLFARFEALPTQLRQIQNLLEIGIRENKTNHALSMTNVADQFNKLQVENVEDSPFYGPLKKFPESIGEGDRTVLRTTAKNLLQRTVLPAFKELGQFISEKYMAALRPEIAASSLPNGEEFYQQALRFHLSLDMKPEEVHQVGLREVTRIKGEMKKIISDLRYTDTIKEFTERLRNDDQFYFNSTEELIAAVENMVFNEIQPKISQVIKTQPKAALIIKPMSGSTPNAPLAYYMGGSIDGSRSGAYLINTHNVKSVPKYDLPSLCLHEALPGHHLQISLAIEDKNAPMFRRGLEDRRYYEAPSRFPINTAYVEGWGLYSEFLGEELGVYTDVYSRFGRYSWEMFRACRLVVDTGMHALGWSAQKAIDYMAENTASSLDNIKKEVHRYITWPGQACGYKIGEIKLRDLREKASRSLGSKFDIREFHDVVLKCGGSLRVLEGCVDKYINTNK